MEKFNRRALLRAIPPIAAAVALPSCAPLALAAKPSRIVGARDRIDPCEKFDGDGWYAFTFTPGREGAYVVQYAGRLDHQFIELRDGPLQDLKMTFSHSAFDFYCVGKMVPT